MQFYENKKILVTGGAGFIGSHLVERLISLGAQVTVLDDLSTGFEKNLSAVIDKVSLIRGTITDFDTCQQAVRGQDVVFHLAAFISVPQSVADPLTCFRINCGGTLQLLEACRLHDVPRFVFSSSSAVYGNYEGICTEETPTHPTSPYGLSKLIGELYAQQYAHLYGIKAVCLRYFNVYGERQNPQGAYAAVVAKFTECLKTNTPLIIYGDGTQSRDFIQVAEVVNANLQLGMASSALMNGQVFNIASGKSITLLELVDKLRQENQNSTAALVFAPARAGDIKHSAAQIHKYQRATAHFYES